MALVFPSGARSPRRRGARPHLVPNMSPETTAVLGLVGALTQLGSITLILLLMLLLYSEQRGVAHFRRWTEAWLVFAVAITAVALRYSLLGAQWDVWQLPDNSPVVRTLYASYATGKFWYLALLVVGVRLFCAPEARVPSTPMLGLACGCAGIAAIAAVPHLDQFMIVQSVVAVPALSWCAIALVRRHHNRRSVGVLLLSAAFGAHALLWLAYGVAFASQALHLTAEPIFIQRYNSYFDVVLQTLLAYGMVAVQMERATHESREAHASLQAAHAELRRSSLFDPLSGILNRQAYASGHGLDAAMKVGGTVAIIDVDHLKPINDTLGHSAGDSLLKHIAEAVSHAMRAGDALYRWGGDEFLVILPNADAASAGAILDRALATASTLSWAGILVPVRASYGCAAYASRDDLEDAIATADRAMYEAKGALRSRVRSMSPTDLVGVGSSIGDGGAL